MDSYQIRHKNVIVIEGSSVADDDEYIMDDNAYDNYAFAANNTIPVSVNSGMVVVSEMKCLVDRPVAGQGLYAGPGQGRSHRTSSFCAVPRSQPMQPYDVDYLRFGKVHHLPADGPLAIGTVGLL